MARDSRQCLALSFGRDRLAKQLASRMDNGCNPRNACLAATSRSCCAGNKLKTAASVCRKKPEYASDAPHFAYPKTVRWQHRRHPILAQKAQPTLLECSIDGLATGGWASTNLAECRCPGCTRQPSGCQTVAQATCCMLHQGQRGRLLNGLAE